jgi:hypothetical protein
MSKLDVMFDTVKLPKSEKLDVMFQYFLKYDKSFPLYNVKSLFPVC